LAAGQYTDDTKMMLCIAESMVERGHVDPDDVARRFVAWFDTGDLRGIGNTCLESILRLKSRVSWRDSGSSGKWAAGNGTAMRIAPVGLLDCQDLEGLRKDCWSTSIITHNNPEAVAGATVVAYVIARLVTGDLDEETLLADSADFVGKSEVAHNLIKAQGLLTSTTPTDEALAMLGTSGYVVETVASALYCFLRTPADFVTTVSTAIMGGGDTDTTAAVAGAISGAYNGLGNLPAHLVEQVEDSERLQQLSRAIFHLAGSKGEI
jgi:ADP-ribosyl-[dinitrogen reductase] hydrolase